jgi:hypothetical protein
MCSHHIHGNGWYGYRTICIEAWAPGVSPEAGDERQCHEDDED